MRIFGIHIYGTSDPDSPPPLAPGGMRGERTGQQNSSGFAHAEEVNDRPIVIEETSGVAFAEAAGLKKDAK
jgi:hypothetical protein